MYTTDNRDEVIEELEQDINELNASLYQAEQVIASLEQQLAEAKAKQSEYYVEAIKYKQHYQSLIVEIVNLSKQ